ncbi:MAG: ABC transporter substrate-binding protein [Eubacteriales bacterium]|nr:ABC transporter substrate-binding protein [Eubacteriales bacterium]
MKKFINTVLVAAMSASILAGCGGSQSSSATTTAAASGETAAEDNSAAETAGTEATATSKVFILPINTNTIPSLTPYNVYGNDDRLIATAPAFDPLFIITKDGTRWYLADSLEQTADDGCHYQLKLKDGLTWHDGEAITADDVVFTVNALLDATNGGSLQYVSYNGKDIVAEKADELTVDITLQEPYSAFESEFGRIQIFPEHVFGGDTKIKDNIEALNSGVGSGPFKLKENNEGQSIVYERYDDYYRGKADLDQVVIRMMPDESAQEAALQSGELSMMRITNPTKLAKYEADENYTVYNIPEGRLNYLAFNYQSPLMKNIDARKAICLALNGEEIIQGAYGSEELAIVAKNFCSPENLYYNDEMEGYQQNIEEAKALAESSGLAGQTLHYIYNQQRPNMKETAQIVQQQLQQIGVNVEIEAMDSAAFFPHLFAAWRGGNFTEDTSWEMASNGMDQMNADPATKLTSWTGDPLDKGFYVSDATNKLWTEASQALTTEEREEKYKELQVQMNEDYSMYPMANTNYVIVARKEFKGLDDIKRVPIFEDYLKITVE